MRRQLLNKFIGNFSWTGTGIPVTFCGIAVTYPLADTYLRPAPPASTGWVMAIYCNQPVTLAATGSPHVICQTPSSSGPLTDNNLRVLFYSQVRHPCIRVGS